MANERSEPEAAAAVAWRSTGSAVDIRQVGSQPDRLRTP
jgi:hypothetical protein